VAAIKLLGLNVSLLRGGANYNRNGWLVVPEGFWVYFSPFSSVLGLGHQFESNISVVFLNWSLFNLQ